MNRHYSSREVHKYTMATTPPPKPMEEITAETKQETEQKSEEQHSRKCYSCNESIDSHSARNLNWRLHVTYTQAKKLLTLPQAIANKEPNSTVFS